MNKTLLLLLWAASAAQAQVADGGLQVATELARITTERQQIEQRHADEEAACFQKFAVNDCRDASRARRRADLADLRRQEIALNDAERKRKGAEQLQRMEQSAAAKDQPAAAPVTASPRAPTRSRPAAEPRPARDTAQLAQERAQAQAARQASAENKARKHQAEQAARAQRAATASAEAARYARKQQDAADHKAAIAQRNAARTKPKAAPLPEPAP